MIASLLSQLKLVKQSTPSELIASMANDPFEQAEWLPILWYLIAQHQIGVDLDQPLNMNSIIWGLP